MRFYVFITLCLVAGGLALALLGLGLQQPEARIFGAQNALAAAPQPSATTAPPATPTSTSTPAPTHVPTATHTPTASSTPTATSTPPPTSTPTATPVPQVLAAKAVNFTPSSRAVRANIRLALAMYQGALENVVLGPGEVFSFNAALGLRPQRLPWKYVEIKPTPAPDAPPDAPAGDAERIQGGGLCDLASRFVMAARPLLPAKAFRFVNHLRSKGIRLAGVPARDSVAIWAVGGGPGEQDLKITNTTGGWLQFITTREGEKITVTALLWDRPPP
jgi:hypothetical protein